MPTSIKEFLVSNGLVLATIVVTMMVNLAVLDVKFEAQTAVISVNQGLLSTIQEDLKSNTLKLNDLSNVDLRLESRLTFIEGYVPHDITLLDKNIVSLAKDYELMLFRINSYHE